MKYIAMLHISIRIISTILIFLLIKIESDYLVLVSIYSLTQILIGILGQFVAVYKFNIKYQLPSPKDLKFRMKEEPPCFFCNDFKQYILNI